ncbi:hypothetical protein LTR66_008706 [Elasticomyces elasticus]|nr:hypothetical protein LTR66_008706 [Elasticomyces elasticus]KAK5011204.1 hypothetical protein LTR28_004912 [Elasticomyces elasticus]
MAQSLGIIWRYVQGMSLTFTGQRPVTNLPLPEFSSSIWSFAQLTWPSLDVFAAALKTKGYKESAGKHEFARPLKILLTERLESDATSYVAAQPGAVRLITVVYPLSSTPTDKFRAQWAVHTESFGHLCPHYQRNICLDLTRERIDEVLEQTQFSPAEPVLQGGYEEMVFSDAQMAQEFLDKHSKQMQLSYENFCSAKSFCVGLDSVVQHSEGDRGIKQVILGRVVSMALGLGLVP